MQKRGGVRLPELNYGRGIKERKKEVGTYARLFDPS